MGDVFVIFIYLDRIIEMSLLLFLKKKNRYLNSRNVWFYVVRKVVIMEKKKRKFFKLVLNFF